MRKVVPLDRALQGRQAWMTGLKRVDALTRAATPIVSWDESRRLVKVNPIATWTEDDVDQLPGRPRSPHPPPRPPGLPLHRLRADDPAGGTGRRSPRRTLGGQQQDRMRLARLTWRRHGD